MMYTKTNTTESYICNIMLNLGIIGEIKSLEPYIKRIRQNPKIHIAGKSS